MQRCPVPRSADEIEFWIENRVMLELLTKQMEQEYLQPTGVTKETGRLRSKSR
jgi:hypothetical protein